MYVVQDISLTALILPSLLQLVLHIIMAYVVVTRAIRQVSTHANKHADVRRRVLMRASRLFVSCVGMLPCCV